MLRSPFKCRPLHDPSVCEVSVCVCVCDVLHCPVSSDRHVVCIERLVLYFSLKIVKWLSLSKANVKPSEYNHYQCWLWRLSYIHFWSVVLQVLCIDRQMYRHTRGQTLLKIHPLSQQYIWHTGECIKISSCSSERWNMLLPVLSYGYTAMLLLSSSLLI